MSNPNVAIRVISLLGSVRRARVIEQLDGLGLDWRFFDALVGPPPDIPYDAAKTRRRHGRELSQGELGCFASHRALWHQAAGDSAPDVTLVLEDDVLVDPHFFSNIGTVAAAASAYPYLRLYAKFPESISWESVFLDR